MRCDWVALRVTRGPNFSLTGVQTLVWQPPRIWQSSETRAMLFPYFFRVIWTCLRAIFKLSYGPQSRYLYILFVGDLLLYLMALSFALLSQVFFCTTIQTNRCSSNRRYRDDYELIKAIATTTNLVSLKRRLRTLFTP